MAHYKLPEHGDAQLLLSGTTPNMEGSGDGGSRTASDLQSLAPKTTLESANAAN